MTSLSFTATIIPGAGRGKGLGTPTLNLNLDEVPANLDEGIYAVWVAFGGSLHQGALHYGPRPVFKDTLSCEVFVLDEEIVDPPKDVEIIIVSYLRPVLDFASPQELSQQIEDDVTRTREILSKNTRATSD